MALVIGPYAGRVARQPARSLPRGYVELVADAPARIRVAAFRAALELLRPLLSQIWLNTTPATGSWPADLRAHADVLPDLVAAQPPAVARRPGTGPDTLCLDPTDDDSFALVQRLGPFAGGVSAMSRDGKLVCDTTGHRWRWRLTSIEYADLNKHLAAVAAGRWLVTVPKPRRPPAGLPWLFVLGAVVWAPGAIRRGLDGLHHPGLDLDTATAALNLTMGSIMIVLAVATLARAGRGLRWR